MAPAPITFIPLNGGRLTAGDARTGSVRGLDLGPFEIARTPVTRRQYDLLRSDAASPGASSPPAPGMPSDRDRRPQTPITWFEAVRWCNRRSEFEGLSPAYRLTEDWVFWDTWADGVRLPTEAEWEFACRAGTQSPTYGPLAEIAWTAADDVGGAQPVGLKRPNALGLYDMLGNAWEWCWDFADPARYGRYRSLRGGGWADPHWSCRASVRRGSAPDAIIEDVGFRPARGAVGDGSGSAQGWSDTQDRARADLSGPIPFGWTPIIDFPTSSDHGRAGERASWGGMSLDEP